MKIPNQSNVTYNAVIPGKPGPAASLASNTVNTEILSYAVSKVSSCDKTLVKEGETVHNTVTITNNSTTKLTHNFISNPTPNGANYVAGSIKVNGVVQPTHDIITGFFLPDLNPGETLTIEYDMQITTPTTTTSVTDLSEFQYTVNDPVRGNVNYSENTDMLSLNVISDKLNNAIQTVIWIPYNNDRNVTHELICCCDCCNCFDCNDYCNCCDDCSDN